MSMIALLIVIAVCAVEETIIFLFHHQVRHHREQITKRSLYKLMEERTLLAALRGSAESGQAAAVEYQSSFLRVEFIDTKPWMAHIFALEEAITIGRSRDNKIAIRDDRLSRHHCKIACLNGRLYLQDLGSANGTGIKRGWFHKIEIPQQQMECLEDNDIIIIGNYRMKIKIYYGYEAVGNCETR